MGTVVACGRAELDLASPDAIRARVREIKPDIIVNAAAYNAVDKAESEPALAMAANATAPGVMAEEARRTGALQVHYSTDYVFDGEKTEPYVETDPTNPINEYGRSKLAGEQAIAAAGYRHLVFRTSWVYAARGKNFPLTILRLARERGELRIVDDQVGAPTSAPAIARATAQAMRQALREGDEASGIYHMTAGGQTSWCGFTKAILDRAGRLIPSRPALRPIATADYPTPARRPRYSVLACGKLREHFEISLAPWEKGLDEVIADLRSDG